jgi:hypothetical protein
MGDSATGASCADECGQALLSILAYRGEARRLASMYIRMRDAGPRQLAPIENALIAAMQVCRKGNPSALWDLAGMELPDSAARLLMTICVEQLNPYPLLDYLERESPGEQDKKYALLAINHIISGLAGEARMDSLLEICNDARFPMSARENAETAIARDALYVLKIKGDKPGVWNALLDARTPESAKLAAIGVCREMGWPEPLESLKGVRGNSRDVRDAAKRAGKEVARLSRQAGMDDGGRRMMPAPGKLPRRPPDVAKPGERLQKASRKN